MIGPPNTPLNGEQAAELGLVTLVADDPFTEAMVLAREIADRSPPAIRAAKRLFARFDDGDAAALLQAESDEQQVLVDAIWNAIKTG